MKLIRYPKAVHFPQGCVATIGNFDGLHLGHQALLHQLVQQAQTMRLPSVVITFEPLPKEYFSKEISSPRLTRFKEKYHYLKKFGIDAVVCLHFNAKLAQWTAENFINRLLLEALKIKYLIIGEDFRFGFQRKGDSTLLQSYSEQYAFILETASAVTTGGERVSSTRIREALQKNQLELAEVLLGRPYSISGKVIHGDKRARQWGIPTANLNVHRSILPTILPVKGVYAVWVEGMGMRGYPGVANVGTRPTLQGFRHLLEVHLLNFNDMIYGKTIEVKFLRKMRDEKRFDSMDLLKQQIVSDVEAAKVYFSSPLVGEDGQRPGEG